MNILVLRSSFQTDEFVWKEYADLLQQLKDRCQANIQINGERFSNTVMVATGGVENQFKILAETQGIASLQAQPVTLIADGRNNSLAAALEILTWLETQGIEGRILHGTNDEIVASLRHCDRELAKREAIQPEL